MSHRALIAERQHNDRFNVYYSRNGAEEIHLLDELRESLNVHGRVDWESLTGRTAPPLAQQMAQADGSTYEVNWGDTGNVVEPRPVAVNVRQEEVLAADNLLEFEVLYVVDEGDVEAYWLAWTYPDVIRPWRDHLEVDAYDPEGAPTDPDGIMEFIDDTEPVRTITDFEHGWLADDLARELVRDAHRWIYELHSMTMADQDVEDASTVQQLLQTPEYWLVVRSNTDEVLAPPSPPFIVPIRIGSPPAASSEEISQRAARTRFSVGAGLNAANEPTESDVQEAYTDALAEIVDTHLDRVAPEFMPGWVGRVIEEYQQTHGRDGFDVVWKGSSPS